MLGIAFHLIFSNVLSDVMEASAFSCYAGFLQACGLVLQAENFFLKALEIDPNDSTALLNVPTYYLGIHTNLQYARFLQRRGDVTNANVFYQRCTPVCYVTLLNLQTPQIYAIATQTRKFQLSH